MPHECTACGRTFPDGSKQMLEGCPDCGGKKFQFRPEGREEPTDPGPAEDAAQASARSELASETEVQSGSWVGGDVAGVGTAPEQADMDDSGVDAAGGTDAPDPDAGADAGAADGDGNGHEDTADGKWGTEEKGLDRPPTPERPNLEELREELNDQFESIRIVQPGRYELNLMELYDRGEYIIALEEDGKYVIDVPQARQDGPDATE